MIKTFDSNLEFFTKISEKRSRFLLIFKFRYITHFLVNLYFKKNMKLHVINLFILSLTLSFSKSYSQKSIVASGGKVIGAKGTASFSVGQISCKSPNGNIVSDGVQLPYEIVTLGKTNFDNILEMNVFPNPTASELSLKIDKIKQNLYIQLLDISEKSLSFTEKINEKETMINFNQGIY